MTAIAGPTIGPVPAIEVKWWPNRIDFSVGTKSRSSLSSTLGTRGQRIQPENLASQPATVGVIGHEVTDHCTDRDQQGCHSGSWFLCGKAFLCGKGVEAIIPDFLCPTEVVKKLITPILTRFISSYLCQRRIVGAVRRLARPKRDSVVCNPGVPL